MRVSTSFLRRLAKRDVDGPAKPGRRMRNAFSAIAALMHPAILLAEGADLFEIGIAEVADRGGEHLGLLLLGRRVGDQLGGALDDPRHQLAEIDRIVVLEMRFDKLVDLAMQALCHRSPISRHAVRPDGSTSDRAAAAAGKEPNFRRTVVSREVFGHVAAEVGTDISGG